MCTRGDWVIRHHLALAINYRDLRMQVLLVIDNHHGILPGGQIHLLLHGHALNDIVETNFAGLLGQNRHIVGIPLNKCLALLHLATIRHGNHRSNRHIIILHLVVLGIKNGHRTILI